MSDNIKDLNLEFSDFELDIISQLEVTLNLLDITPPLRKNIIYLSGLGSTIDIELSVVNEVRTIGIVCDSKPINYRFEGEAKHPVELDSILNVIKLRLTK